MIVLIYLKIDRITGQCEWINLSKGYYKIMSLIQIVKTLNPSIIRLQKALKVENIKYIDKDNKTILINVFENYGLNGKYAGEILLQILDMDCNIGHVDNLGKTALMHGFENYGSNPNCDPKVFLKMLDMDCNIDYVDNLGKTALMHGFENYGSNLNCNP